MSTFAAMPNGDGQRQVSAPAKHKWRKPLFFRSKASGNVKSHATYLREAAERAKQLNP